MRIFFNESIRFSILHVFESKKSFKDVGGYLTQIWKEKRWKKPLFASVGAFEKDFYSRKWDQSESAFSNFSLITNSRNSNKNHSFAQIKINVDISEPIFLKKKGKSSVRNKEIIWAITHRSINDK